MALRKYTKNQLDETSGTRGKKTGIASCYVRFRPKGSVMERDAGGFGNRAWWKWGAINGDPATIENNLQTYKNMTQMITRTIGNQKTGNDTAKTSFNLKDINPHAKALMFNSSYGPSVAYTLAAGTRKYVSTWTGVFVASQTITMTFTTTKESTDTTTSATTVSVPFATDDTTTKANLLTAIKANSGIDGTLTSFSGNTLTIRTKTGYYMTVTAQMTSTGGSSPPTTTNVETDTSIVTTSIDQTNGTISRTQLPLVTGGAAKIQAVIDNAPEGALVQIEVLTGTDGVTVKEYPLVARLSDNMLILNEALDQLPADLAEIKVVAYIDYFPGGDNLKEFEVQLEFRDHSNKAVSLVYIPCFSPDEGTKAPNFTKEGRTGVISGVCVEELFTVSGDEILLPFVVRDVNSAVGVY